MEKRYMAIFSVVAVLGIAAMMASSGGLTGAVASDNAACVILPNDNGQNVFAGDGLMRGGNTCVATLTEDGPETCLDACSTFARTKDLWDASNKLPGCADGYDTDGDGDVDCDDFDCFDSAFCGTPEADLEITLTGPTTVLSTDLVMYGASVHNYGPDLADDAVVTITFPAGITVVTPPPGGSCAGGTCFYPAFDAASGSTASLPQIAVQWSGFAGSQRFVEADVSSFTDDPDEANNFDIMQVNIN